MERSTQRITDFPVFAEKPMERHYPVNAEKLLERFKRIGYAVSLDDKRPTRCCIEFVGDKILAVDGYSESNNKLGLGYRELMEHLKDKDPAYYYSDILIPNGKTLRDFINAA